MPNLVLGPLLRHVGERDATIWVETSGPCEVEVRAGTAGGRQRTFAVAGHNYAIVVVHGLQPGTASPYEVLLDAAPVWPEAASSFPPSRIRTVDTSRPVSLVFGSCRGAPEPEHSGNGHGRVDALDALAQELLGLSEAEWPDLLLFVGDQVYADETSPAMQDYIRSRRDIEIPPKTQVANFEEYTRLYVETWSVPRTRWLLSTLPTSMIFDDHDVVDDWNTSHAWRLDMQATSWWEERITGALMSYWIYQHLGNLSPAGLASDETYGAVRAATDAEAILRAFAQAADREADGAKGAMWSYRRDLGSVRVITIDSRCGRILAEGRRSMVSEVEAAWIEQQVLDGPIDHLVVVTSMPWLLPRALHDLESWNEALCRPTQARWARRWAERLRRAIDLEHWAAFRESFDWLAALFAGLGRGTAGVPAPATICVMSGDVHHTYVSEAHWEDPVATRVFQLTCSPIQNTIPPPMRVIFRIGWSKKFELLLRALDRITGVPPLDMGWHHPTGPHFGNMLVRLTLDGRRARALLHRADGPDRLETVADLPLTSLPRAEIKRRREIPIVPS